MDLHAPIVRTKCIVRLSGYPLIQDSLIRARSFEEGDLVLRHVQSAKNSNKLTPKWEGPYRVTRVTRPGAVRLDTEDAVPVRNRWNIEHLSKYFPYGAVAGPPRKPHFCTSLVGKACNPLYKARRRP